MKAVEVYKEITSVLKPILKDNGFKKISSSRPKWYKDYENFSMHLYFRTDKYSWEPYKGCTLALCAYICPLGMPFDEVECNSQHSRRFIPRGSIEMRDAHKRNLLVSEKIRKLSLQKILNDPKYNFEDIKELQELHESTIFLLNLESDLNSTELLMDTEIKYLDPEDVLYLSEYYSKFIIKNIIRLYDEELRA
jgi:hypothetical protein